MQYLETSITTGESRSHTAASLQARLLALYRSAGEKNAVRMAQGDWLRLQTPGFLVECRRSWFRKQICAHYPPALPSGAWGCLPAKSMESL